MSNAMKWLVSGLMVMVLSGAANVLAADEFGGPAGDKKAQMAEARDLMVQIKQKEKDVLANDPALKQAMEEIDAQIEELEKGRQAKLAAADPSLSALYEKMNQMKADRKAKMDAAKGGKGRKADGDKLKKERGEKGGKGAGKGKGKKDK